MSVYRNGYSYSVSLASLLIWDLHQRILRSSSDEAYIGNSRVVNNPCARTADRKRKWANDRRAATVAA